MERTVEHVDVVVVESAATEKPPLAVQGQGLVTRIVRGGERVRHNLMRHGVRRHRRAPCGDCPLFRCPHESGCAGGSPVADHEAAATIRDDASWTTWDLDDKRRAHARGVVDRGGVAVGGRNPPRRGGACRDSPGIDQQRVGRICRRHAAVGHEVQNAIRVARLGRSELHDERRGQRDDRDEGHDGLSV